MRSTTVVTFVFPIVLSSFLRAHCRARKDTDAKHMNVKFRIKKIIIRNRVSFETRVKHIILIYDKVK